MNNSDRLRQLYRMSQSLVRLYETGQIVEGGLGRDILQSLAAARALEEIGNQAWELEKAGAFPDSLGFEAHELSGLRHRVAHHYESVDWGIVSSILTGEITRLRDGLRRVLSEEKIDFNGIDQEVEMGIGQVSLVPGSSVDDPAPEDENSPEYAAWLSRHGLAKPGGGGSGPKQ